MTERIHSFIHSLYSICSGPHTSNVTDADCIEIDILGNTIEESSVYLFPFIIEFSMICAHILYNMWTNVGSKPKFAMVGEEESREEIRG